MEEKVYSGMETENLKDIRIPKNIRQIGENKSQRKIYIEDYVMSQLKKKPDRDNEFRYGVLLGEINRSKGNTYIFIRGMVETREVIENSLIFNEETWSTIYKDVKEYFEGTEIVGWFSLAPYTIRTEMNQIRKIHLDHFAGNDKVCYLNDRAEEEDGFFVYESGRLNKQSGYFVFYEKNEKMKKYLKQTQGLRSVPVNLDDNKERGKEKTIASDIKSVSDRRNNDMPERASLRDNLRQQISENNGKVFRTSRVAYGLSSILVIALLLSTVVMLNNYGELKKLKTSLENINEKKILEVNEILTSIIPPTTVGEQGEENGGNKEVININDEDNNDVTNDSSIDDDTSSMDETGQTNIQDNNESDDQSGYDEEGTISISSVGEEEKPVAADIYSGMTYEVKKGQTLYDISVKFYGDSSMVDTIKEYNDIDDDYKIRDGQIIKLP